MMFDKGNIRITSSPGAWLAVPFHGSQLSRVELSLGPDDWRPAFYEAGKVMIRCPELEGGSYELWARVNGHTQQVAVVSVK